MQFLRVYLRDSRATSFLRHSSIGFRHSLNIRAIRGCLNRRLTLTPYNIRVCWVLTAHRAVATERSSRQFATEPKLPRSSRAKISYPPEQL